MEIKEFTELAGRINFIGSRLQKISVGIDAWSYPLGGHVRPLLGAARYTVRYYYSAGNEATTCATGSGISPHSAITAAFVQFLEKEHAVLPDPTIPQVIQLVRKSA